MTVAEAVDLHQKYFTPEVAIQFKISGPAYSQGKLDDLKVSQAPRFGLDLRI